MTITKLFKDFFDSEKAGGLILTTLALVAVVRSISIAMGRRCKIFF